MTLSATLQSRFREPGGSTFDLDISLRLEGGETLVVLGPSGSGKTLLLETLAGFHPHRGKILLDAETLHDKRPERRGFSYVFQDHALWPHMSVQDNVAFVRNKKGNGRTVREMLRLLEIEHLAARYPATLSGGERQRVALARALIVQPRLMLLDEPLSSLDLPGRENLRRHLLELLADMTAVYVTHDRDEARLLADRIAVIRDGRVVQSGHAEDIFSAPANAFVARFTGANCLPLQHLTAALRSWLPNADGEFLVVRPEHIALCEPGHGLLPGRVLQVLPEGGWYRVRVVQGDAVLDVLSPIAPAVDAVVGLEFSPGALATI